MERSESERFALETQHSHPFEGELTEIQRNLDGFVHKLEKPEEEVALEDGAERDFDTPNYAVTEYQSYSGKSHEEFVRLKRFYEELQEAFGDYLPKAMFVEGASSDGQRRSMYVIQKLEKKMEGAKKFDELNSQEFTPELAAKLLDLQQRIDEFVSTSGLAVPERWTDKSMLDRQGYKEQIIVNPEDGQPQIANMFRLSPDLAKEVAGSDAKFEPVPDRLKLLKLFGTAKLYDNISWINERMAPKEWLGQTRELDTDKLEAEGKKAMALTFDDGPNEETEVLLDILKEKGVKATFFLVGSLIRGREDTVRRIIAEGHEVGVHDFTHPSGDIKGRFIGPWNYFGDTKRGLEELQRVTGERPKLARMAGIHGTVESMREAQALELQGILAYWKDLAFMMPNEKTKASSLLKMALKNNGQGRIRIFHIGQMTNEGVPKQRSDIMFDKGQVYHPEEVLKMIGGYIDKSREEGYDFVKVGDYLPKRKKK